MTATGDVSCVGRPLINRQECQSLKLPLKCLILAKLLAIFRLKSTCQNLPLQCPKQSPKTIGFLWFPVKLIKKLAKLGQMSHNIGSINAKKKPRLSHRFERKITVAGDLNCIYSSLLSVSSVSSWLWCSQLLD